MSSVRSLGPAAALLTAGLLLTGCVGAAGTAGHADPAPAATTTTSAKDRGLIGRAGPEARAASAGEIPGLGPLTRAEIPQDTRQAVVVTGAGRDANRSTVRVYERDSGSEWAAGTSGVAPRLGWHPVAGPWPAHNALDGWTGHHVQSDRRSPIGVYGLTDAGGSLPDPGTKLPYDRSDAFYADGTGFHGESLEGSFDYVVAINYNREAGTTPLDWTRPLGGDRGGGIWIHVDHGGPTQGCVSLPRDRVKQLLELLDPDQEPVVVMGDATSLER